MATVRLEGLRVSAYLSFDSGWKECIASLLRQGSFYASLHLELLSSIPFQEEKSKCHIKNGPLTPLKPCGKQTKFYSFSLH